MRNIKGIIVGTGRAGTYLQFGAFKLHGADIVAFVDSNLNVAREAARKFKVQNSYSSLEEALDKNDVSFVSICTPPSSHLSLAKIVLENGCHVLIEKPVTSTLSELDELGEIVRKSNKTVCVVHNHKFYPGIQKAKEIIDKGGIGKINHIYRQMSFRYKRVRMMEQGHWAHKIPGGRLFEANPHNLYLLYNFIGPFELLDIFPRNVSKRWPHAKIDEFSALARTKETIIDLRMNLNIENSEHYKDSPPNFFVITGDKAILLVDYHRAKYYRNAMINRYMYRDFPKMIKSSIAFRLKKLPNLKDQDGQKINMGVGSGHYHFIEKYLGFLSGKYPKLPVSWQEICFVEKMNEKMGRAVENKIIANYAYKRR